MNINLTLLGQMLTFLVFVWFTMKYVWPPMMKAMEERQKKIADGLAAAEQGVRDLELAERKIKDMLTESKQQASTIIDEANKRSEIMIDDAKEAAREESQRIVKHAQEQIQQELVKAKEDLRKQVGALAIETAEKILGSSVNAQDHEQLINAAVKEL